MVRKSAAAIVLLAAMACGPAAADEQPAAGAPKKPLKSKTGSAEERADALSRASVWRAPAPIASARLGGDPKQPQSLACTFEITELGGTAPKFDCRLAGGDR